MNIICTFIVSNIYLYVMTDISYNWDDINSISNEIKSITLDKANKEWNKISEMTMEELTSINGRSKIGCDLVDYYFFKERLLTIGNKGINFLDFLRDIDSVYKNKHYIQTLLVFCEKNNRYKDSLIKRYYYIYGLCFGRVNAFKITNAVYIYKKYPCTKVLDPFCGFGGRMIGAMMTGIDYKGYDLNVNLNEGYQKIYNDFLYKCPSSNINVEFIDSLQIDYTNISQIYDYDMVFTSPPYKNIEIYRCSEKKTDTEWSLFYDTIFQNTWNGLKDGGYFIININEDIYTNSLIKLFGECREKLLLKKTKKNSYDEYIYIWIKEHS